MLKERVKGIAIGAVATLALTTTVPVLGNAITTAIQVTYRNIGVSVDGRTIITQQEPFIFEGRTYLAISDIAEAFNAEIRMNESTDTVEITSRQAGQTAATPVQPTAPAVAVQPTVPSTASSANRSQRPANPSITREAADQIAANWLNQQGITGVWRDGGISMDFEYGRWVWEVEYENRTREWDFYIDVNTGEIVHIDQD